MERCVRQAGVCNGSTPAIGSELLTLTATPTYYRTHSFPSHLSGVNAVVVQTKYSQAMPALPFLLRLFRGHRVMSPAAAAAAAVGLRQGGAHRSAAIPRA
jgi:hypothetical protein